MSTTLQERWSPKTQGYSQKTLPERALQNAPPKTTLSLGSGLRWDPAEAARVAAAEARREREGSPPSSRASPRRVKKKDTSNFMIRPGSATRYVDTHGWLSQSARSNEKDRTRAPPAPSPPPIQGPLDPRVLGRMFRALEVEDDPADDASKVRTGHDGKSTSGWNWDADYADKDPVDYKPILNRRINGGVASPSRWDPKTLGYVGTDRMRIVPDGSHGQNPGLKATR